MADPKRIQFEGKVYSFPADATDAEIAAALTPQSQASTGDAPPARPPGSVDLRRDVGRQTGADRVLAALGNGAAGAGSYVDNLGRQFAGGATFGGMDEADAALRATFGQGQVADAFGQTQGPSWADRYGTELARSRARDKEFSTTNPVAATTANVAGTVAGAVAALPQFMLTMPSTLAKAVPAGIAQGAALGLTNGFLTAEGGVDKRLEEARKAAQWGAAGGGLVPIGLRVASPIWRTVAEGPVGQFVGENVISPIARGVETLAEKAIPKVIPQSLSAGSTGGAIAGDGFMANLAAKAGSIADATTASAIAERGAMLREIQALQRRGLSPDEIAKRLQTFGQPGVIGDLEVGGTAMARLLRNANTMPGSANDTLREFFKTRSAGAQPRMAAGVDEFAGEATPFVAQFENARFDRRKAAGEAYNAAEEAALAWKNQIGAPTPELNRLLGTEEITKTIDWLRKDYAAKGIPISEMALADKAKQQLRDNAEAAFRGGGAVNKDAVATIAGQWERALYDANPQLGRAAAGYAADSAVMDAMTLGRKYAAQGANETADTVSAKLLAGFATQAERDGFAIGMAQSMRDEIGKGPDAARRVAKMLEENTTVRERIVSAIGEPEAAKLFALANRERAMQETANFVRGGSNSIDKAADALDQGVDFPHTMKGLMARIGRYGAEAIMAPGGYLPQANERVRTALTGHLIESNPTAQLQLLERLDALMKANATGGGAVRAALEQRAGDPARGR